MQFKTPLRLRRATSVLSKIVLFAFAVVATSLASAAPIRWNSGLGANGHYYEYVSNTLSWDDARIDAENRTHLGITGHLVTITSQAEQDFIYDNVTHAFADAGASDAEVEGVWKWVVGPEAGTVFWQDGVGALGYEDWWFQGPSDGGSGEDYLMINYHGYWNPAPAPGWNDYSGNAGYGYIVEYSHVVPEPSTYAMAALALAGLGFVGWRRKRMQQPISPAKAVPYTTSRAKDVNPRKFTIIATAFVALAVPSWACPVSGQIVVAPGFRIELVNADLPGLSTPTPGLAIVPNNFGPYGGDVLVVNRGSSSSLNDGEILRVDPVHGTRSVFAEVDGNPTHLAFGPGGNFGSDLFVSSNQNPFSTNSGRVWTVSDTGTVTAFGNQDPDAGNSYLFGGVGLAFSTGGAFGEHLYSGTSGGFSGDSITRMSPAGGTASLFYSFGGILSGSPSGLAFGPGTGGFDQNLYLGVTTTNTTPAEAGVYVLDSSGSRSSLVTASDPSSNGLITSIAELAFSAGGSFGSDLYAADTAGSILRIDSNGMTVELVSGLDYAFGVAFAGPDALYLTGIDPVSSQLNLYRVTPVPEPSTYVMGVLALVGLGVLGCRRRTLRR